MSHADDRGAEPDAPVGRELWRSVEELAQGEAFESWVARRFPSLAPLAEPSRRQVLKLMAASFALGGLAACRPRPLAEIVPYARAPHHALRAGRPLFTATALLHGGYASPAVVESHAGRPIKVEGNPEHPESGGATDIFAQAAVLRLYDPDRSRTVRRHDQIATWADFAAAWRDVLGAAGARGGDGLRILTGRWCSPTFDAQLARLLEALPAARWHRHEPVDDDAEQAATRAVLGRELVPRPVLSHALRVLALGADPLFESPARVSNAQQLAAARRVWSRADGDMLRFYAVETSPTLTGAKADHRLAVRAADLPRIARRAAARLGVAVRGGEEVLDERLERWIDACTRALREAGARSVVLAGLGASPAVHALALAMNERLGAFGSTLELHPRADASVLGDPGTLVELVDDLRGGAVETLVIVGTNPVYTAPADLGFAAALAAVRGATVHAGEEHDETARACRWHLPLAHELECWHDARSPRGRVTIGQPLIEPLHRGRSPQAVMALLASGVDVARGDAELVRARWSELGPAAWKAALLRGWIEGSEPPAVTPQVDLDAVRELVDADADADAAPREPIDAGGPAPALEAVFRPDDTIWDGRHANNAWLQELPKPITKLTWDNAALVAPALAERHGLRDGDVVRLRLGERVVHAPVQIVPGQAEHSVCLPLGYGRVGVGRVGAGTGFDAYRLRAWAHPWSETGLLLEPTDGHRRLAHTQHHHVMEGRGHLRSGPLAVFRAEPAVLGASHHPAPGGPHGAGGLHAAQPSLLPEWPYAGQQWGMAIDLTSCIGCGACTIACQAENNIPVVGKDQVLAGRELHWIRVDRYFEGPRHDPGFRFQPVPCMHCEKAPCEVVCPVGATQHSHDGLNDMIYNRCVGTRYCSNNCPYKVRRFNFLHYADGRGRHEGGADEGGADGGGLVALQRNPEVTVRSAGVMEKCTYCVQRIRKAEVAAREQGRPIRDGEVVTACQAVCPAQAIVFGDIADPETEVSRWKRAPHEYGVLADLNTQPRTTYLAGISNPDADIERLEGR